MVCHRPLAISPCIRAWNDTVSVTNRSAPFASSVRASLAPVSPVNTIARSARGPGRDGAPARARRRRRRLARAARALPGRRPARARGEADPRGALRLRGAPVQRSVGAGRALAALHRALALLARQRAGALHDRLRARGRAVAPAPPGARSLAAFPPRVSRCARGGGARRPRSRSTKRHGASAGGSRPRPRRERTRRRTARQGLGLRAPQRAATSTTSGRTSSRARPSAHRRAARRSAMAFAGDAEPQPGERGALVAA